MYSDGVSLCIVTKEVTKEGVYSDWGEHVYSYLVSVWVCVLGE